MTKGMKVFMRNTEKYFLQPGYIFVSEEPYLIHAVLGSCIAVCIWDREKNIGGMNHFIYSRANNNVRSCKYGDVSTRHLIKIMIDMGCRREGLMAHIVGGSHNSEFNSNSGNENSRVAIEMLGKYGIKIVTKDIDGQIGRKVVFNTTNGEILVYKVANLRKSDWW